MNFLNEVFKSSAINCSERSCLGTAIGVQSAPTKFFGSAKTVVLADHSATNDDVEIADSDDDMPLDLLAKRLRSSLSDAAHSTHTDAPSASAVAHGGSTAGPSSEARDGSEAGAPRKRNRHKWPERFDMASPRPPTDVPTDATPDKDFFEALNNNIDCSSPPTWAWGVWHNPDDGLSIKIRQYIRNEIGAHPPWLSPLCDDGNPIPDHLFTMMMLANRSGCSEYHATREPHFAVYSLPQPLLMPMAVVMHLL